MRTPHHLLGRLLVAAMLTACVTQAGAAPLPVIEGASVTQVQYREDRYREDRGRRYEEDRRGGRYEEDRRGGGRDEGRVSRGGSYQQSCREVRQQGSTLSASCNNGRGRWVESSIDINRCRGDIGNNGGYLRC